MPGFRRTSHTVLATLLTLAAALLVWFALVTPDRADRLSPASLLLRIPVEGLVVAVLLLVLPRRPARVLAVVAGTLLGVILLAKALDLGFLLALDRRFDPVGDLGYLGPAVGVLSDSVGRPAAIVVAVLIAVVAIALVALMPLAMLRLSGILDRHRAPAVGTVTVLGLVWVVCAVAGVRLVAGVPVASTSAASLAVDEVRQVRNGISDQRRFELVAARDSYGPGTPGLLSGLRGKDVLVVFVESYGRVAVQDSSFSSQVDSVLRAGTRRLRHAGFHSRSAFLTSPTFGGISWLAHSTLESGLWVPNELAYDHLVSTHRFTLSQAFKSAGWRTVGDVPSDTVPWPVGTSFYGYDQTYGGYDVGYRGPKFSYAAMPDQYTLATLQRRELAPRHRRPLMAEVDLVSSHTPWAPLPHMVSWSSVGDGSVFDGLPAQGTQPGDIWPVPSRVQASYGQSIRYTLRALVSFVQHYGRRNLVMVVLGDHQPATIVSGENASHDVPITVVAHDPAVMRRISGWGWQPGMLPAPDAVVWPMSAFRDRLFRAFGPQSPQ